jgi:Fe-S cluster assembly ATP-binding protein
VVTLLAVENLSVSRGTAIVIQRANMSLDRSELHVVLGPNGAGKTTLLEAIAGRSSAQVREGRILLEGRDVTGWPLARRARSGIVLGFQTPPPLRGLRLADLVDVLEKRYGPRDELGWAEELLQITQLLGHSLAGGMSGGERKRAELYLVLLQRPKVALLDEPDSGIDAETLQRIMRTLLEAKKRGIAIVLVSHTLTLLHALAERDNIDAMWVAWDNRLH